MKRRITALLTILCMVLTMMPLHVHATEAGHIHYGGTATCKWKATCEGCGSIYGETDPNNHNDYFGEDNGDGRTHTAMCTCGHVYNASEAHDFSGWEEDGPGQEARFCYECYYTETRSTHTHSYSEATCTAPATCSCGETTGEVDSTNHTGGTEARNAKDASEFEAGYTGDTYCLGCDTKIASGTTIPATHTHNYAAATCTTPATCSCGDTTGGVDSTNHTGGTEVRNAKDASEFEAGYTGDTYCLGCGDLLSSGSTIPATHAHSWEWTHDSGMHWQVCDCGESSTAAQAHQFDDDSDATCDTCGYTREVHQHNFSTATCTTPATCTCGETTGDVDKSNHVGGTEIRNAKDASEFEAGYTGDTYCLGCGDKLSSGSTIPATHSHSYSVATCTTPATCSCNATQGGVDKNNHVGGTEVRGQVDATEFESGYTGDTYCLGCGDKLADGSVIPATHSHSWEWTYDSELHWQKCSSCGESSTAAQEHTFETIVIPPTATQEGGYVFICSVCGYEEHLHTYADATCIAPDTCECGATRGDVDKSNHTGGTEIRNAKDATEFEDGYTGDTYCLGCGDKLADGQSIPATHTHSYTAVVTVPTCSDRGYTTYTCSCNDSYVNDYVDALGHDWGDWTSNGNGYHARTCTTDSSHYQTGKCSGGAATCKELATCSDCGANYGSLNRANHSGGTEVRNAKDATETENGYTGDTYCLGCDMLLNEGDTIPATGSEDNDDDTHTHNYYYYNYDGTNHWKMCGCGQGQAGSVKAHTLVIQGNKNGHWKECTICNYYSDIQAHVYSNDSDETCNDCGYNRHVHSYPTATCAAPATCSCGQTNGGKNPNNHTGGTEIRNAAEATIVAEGYTGDTYCLGCGSMIASGEVIPKAGVIFDGPGVEDVTFIPAEGTELPGDAEIIVNPHTPSADNLAYVLGIDADTEYLDADNVKIQIVGGEDYTAPDGTEYRMHEIIIINGEEYLITNYMGVGDVLVLMRLSDGATGNYNVAVNKLDFTGSMNGTVQEYAYDKINIGGITYDVKLSYNSDAGRVVVLYYNGSPAGKMYINESRSSYFREGFDPETLKAQKNASNLGTVTPGENPIDGLVSGKTYNVSVVGSNDIHLEGAENIGGTVTQTFDIPVQFVNNPNVKYVAVHVSNPYAEALEEAFNAYQSMNEKLYEAIRQYENGEISLEEFNKVRLLSSEALSEYMRLVISYDEWEEEHAADNKTGNDLGIVTISDDGKTLTATYTVSSFSPFTVYAFTEAELPEIKEFVTQPDGTLARAVNGQPIATHTVASGENLTVIARKYGCTVDEIVALNSDLIENPSKIYVGWVLMIPKK